MIFQHLHLSPVVPDVIGQTGSVYIITSQKYYISLKTENIYNWFLCINKPQLLTCDLHITLMSEDV